MKLLIGAAIGMVAGAMIGYGICCLMIIAKREDEQMWLEDWVDILDDEDAEDLDEEDESKCF